MANNCTTASYGLSVTEAAIVPASINGGPEYGMFQSLTFISSTGDIKLRFSDDQDLLTITNANMPVTVPAYTETVYMSAAAAVTVEFIADIKTWTPQIS